MASFTIIYIYGANTKFNLIHEAIYRLSIGLYGHGAIFAALVAPVQFGHAWPRTSPESHMYIYSIDHGTFIAGASFSHIVYGFQGNVITHPCPNFSGSLTYLHGRLICY